ncbi:MAG: beta-propeller repeat protein, partial [Capsulimonas sp.]|nr:beta-propeller repeat protein [Capsulimonas sp.]
KIVGICAVLRCFTLEGNNGTMRRIQWIAAGALAAIGAAAVMAATPIAPVTPPKDANLPLVTGKKLTPEGRQTNVGSFPANLILSPDGKYILVTTAGMREYLSVLRASDGALVSRLDFNKKSTLVDNKQDLYYGLVCGKTEGGVTTVYASRGGEGIVSALALDAEGTLTDTGKTLTLAPEPGGDAAYAAGLALSADGAHLYVADNCAIADRHMRASLRILDTASGAEVKNVDLPGYPFAVAAVTAGADAGHKVYVTSEQRGNVAVVDPETGKSAREIATGTQPIGLLLDKSQGRLFVANAGSDTVSVIDTRTDRLAHTILMRPDNMRGLPGATPTGLALSADEKTLYVTLGDMNAVGVVSLPEAKLAGYLPVGWYPTGAVISPDGKRLFVANAKGVGVRNPNSEPRKDLADSPQYIQNIIDGTVTTIDLAALPPLKTLTAKVLANNQGALSRKVKFQNPGIKHVFYIIKENRTYDQVLGDVPTGNGDPALALYGRDITPNQHALAERFVLLDNFYCCAEVSGDGWNWSTASIASEFNERNVAHNYGGRRRPYDFQGSNNGISVDRFDIPDANHPPGGYIWDQCAAHGVSFRNYGFFTDDFDVPRKSATEGTEGVSNSPTRKTLVGKTCEEFRLWDTNYADSDAWIDAKLTPAPRQMKAYGKYNAPSRVSAWKREFAEYVKNGNLPRFSMICLPRDHTAGTWDGCSSPLAMIADNDYAVGQVADIISHSPYWKSSVIVVVEDDAQHGYDHVDAHRSTAYVISPFIERAAHDSRFYNTDSALRTMELLLGLPPMTQYDAIAPPMDIFQKRAANAEPYVAVLPNHAILVEVNAKTAYRSGDSARLLNTLHEESGPDEQLNDILWRSRKGTPPPPRHYTLSSL